MKPIGIDVGNFETNTSEGLVFESGYYVSRSEPMAADGMICLKYNDLWYSYGKRMPVDMDKTKTDRMWLLSLPCIAHAILQDSEKRESDISRLYVVKVAVGIPISHFGAQKREYVEYYMSYGREPVMVEYCGYKIRFRIKEVYVFPQGASIYVANSKLLQPFDYLSCIDIGGYTVDITRVQEGRMVPAESFSIDMGVITLLNRIQQKLFERNIKIPEKMICRVIQGKDIMHGESEDIKNIVEDEVKQYIYELRYAISEHDIDLQIPACMMGGGSELLRDRLEDSFDVVETFGSFENACSYSRLAMKKGA